MMMMMTAIIIIMANVDQIKLSFQLWIQKESHNKLELVTSVLSGLLLHYRHSSFLLCITLRTVVINYTSL